MKATNPRQLAGSGNVHQNPARDELILDHLGKIRQIAGMISTKLPRYVDREDLVSAGVIGLIDAIDKFDPTRSVRFAAYAQIRIRGAILDSLRRNDWVPRHVRRRSKQIQSLCLELEQNLCRTPTSEELSREMNLPLQKLQKLLNQIGGLGIDAFLDVAFADTPAPGQTPAKDPRASEDPFLAFRQSETREILVRAIQALPSKERLVIFLYYFDELGLKDIARILDTAESRVSQCHTSGLQRLAKKMKSLGVGTVQ